MQIFLCKFYYTDSLMRILLYRFYQVYICHYWHLILCVSLYAFHCVRFFVCILPCLFFHLHLLYDGRMKKLRNKNRGEYMGVLYFPSMTSEIPLINLSVIFDSKYSLNIVISSGLVIKESEESSLLYPHLFPISRRLLGE